LACLNLAGWDGFCDLRCQYLAALAGNQLDTYDNAQKGEENTFQRRQRTSKPINKLPDEVEKDPVIGFLRFSLVVIVSRQPPPVKENERSS
jgi:hypothetical protein